jgi:succinate-semialdehyde dehydrogenase/glutarate-semialdehyde dehydrogenase
MEELFKEAQAQKDIIHQSIDPGRSTALVSDERIKGVSLTVVKLQVLVCNEAAGKYLKNQY